MCAGVKSIHNQHNASFGASSLLCLKPSTSLSHCAACPSLLHLKMTTCNACQNAQVNDNFAHKEDDFEFVGLDCCDCYDGVCFQCLSNCDGRCPACKKKLSTHTIKYLVNLGVTITAVEAITSSSIGGSSSSSTAIPSTETTAIPSTETPSETDKTKLIVREIDGRQRACVEYNPDMTVSELVQAVANQSECAQIKLIYKDRPITLMTSTKIGAIGIQGGDVINMQFGDAVKSDCSEILISLSLGKPSIHHVDTNVILFNSTKKEGKIFNSFNTSKAADSVVHIKVEDYNIWKQSGIIRTKLISKEYDIIFFVLSTGDRSGVIEKIDDIKLSISYKGTVGDIFHFTSKQDGCKCCTYVVGYLRRADDNNWLNVATSFGINENAEANIRLTHAYKEALASKLQPQQQQQPDNQSGQA